MGIVHYLRDGMTGLVNRMTGTGTSRDPNSHNRYVFRKPSPVELEAIYRSNWIARKIVNIPIEDMLRQGWTWTADDPLITALEEEEKRLNLKEILRRALVSDAIYGGAGIFIGTADGALDQELRVERMGKGSISYLTPFHSEDLQVKELSRDPDRLGQPTMFTIRSEKSSYPIDVHPSRVVTFRGRPVDKAIARMTQDEWWGDSRLANVLSDISGASTALTGGARLMGELAIWKYKISGLADTLTTVGGEEQIQKLLTMSTTLKSSLNAVAVDGDDEVDVVTASTAGIADTIRSFMQNVAGAADIPYTRFMSASPDGMNATGASDIRNYYDRLAGDRGAYVDPGIMQLDQALIRSAIGRYDDKIYRSWKPLWQLNETEQTELDAKKINIFGILLDKGLVHDHVVEQVTRSTMIDSPTFPGAEEAFEEAKKIPDPRDEEDEESTDMQAGGGRKPANQPKAPAAEVKLRLVKDMEPTPLYVRRNVQNADEILRWAKSQGFTDLMKPEDLHVTILYSKTPVDWMEMGSGYFEGEAQVVIPEGGPRVVEQFGEATVLSFASNQLRWRHESMVESGASHDFPTYQPHITFRYGEEPRNMPVVPYRGKIVLGPEIFEPINENWRGTLGDEDVFLDKSGKFNESAVNRYPAGSSKGGQFAPKGKAGAAGGGSGPVKHGYAAAYTKAKKYEQKIKADLDADPTNPTLKLAYKHAKEDKKQALKDYYANKGTKAAAVAEAAKPAGLSIAEREAGIAAVKKEKSAALKEYKAHPTGSAEKKAALAVYNEKAATEKKMVEGLEKAKAGGETSPKASPPDTLNLKGSTQSGSLAQAAAFNETLNKTGANTTQLKKALDKEKAGLPMTSTEKVLAQTYKATLGSKEAASSLSMTPAQKHSLAMQQVVAKHPHPTFGAKEAEATIQKGLAGKALGYNEQKLFNTYKEFMNPGSTSAKVASHPSVAPIVKLDISSAFKDIENNPDFKSAADAFKSATTYDQKHTAHFGLVKGITKAIGGNLATPTVSQMTYVEFAEKWSSTEHSALKAYTGSAYSEINSTLRNGKAASPTTQARINAIDKAFTKSVARTDVVLMRGLAPKAVDKYIAEGNFAVGKTMIDKGYVSTTSNYGTAKGFSQGGYQMVIRLKKGQSVAPLEQLSHYSGEKEFLLPRNTAFQIQHIDKTAKIIVVDVL